MRRGTGAGRALIHLSPCGRGRRTAGAAGEGLLRGAFHTPSFVKPGNDEENGQAMRVRVDHAADAVYLNLTDRPIKDSAEVADGIVVDYDNEGRIVGIEILDTAKRSDDPDALKRFSFELPTVG